MIQLKMFCKSLTVLNGLKPVFLTFRSYAARGYPKDLDEKIVLSKNGQTIVCWHPEKTFPYEFSKPIPERVLLKEDTVLKIQATEALRAVRRPKPIELVRQELMAATHTTKHVWFPSKRKFKRKKTPMDRPYL